MTENTLKITFRQAEDHRSAARKRLQRAEAGETDEAIEQDARRIINFENFDDIALLMRTSSLELIEAIVTEQPESIRQAAVAVGRDYRDVHRNLSELEELGVVQFEDVGNRKKPVLRGGVDRIDFSIQFPFAPDQDGTPSAVS